MRALLVALALEMALNGCKHEGWTTLDNGLELFPVEDGDLAYTWHTLVKYLHEDMACQHIVSAGDSSGSWGAIEMASSFTEVEGAVVSNGATNLTRTYD